MKRSDAQSTELNARTAEFVELARQSLGEMSARQRASGLHSLRLRLAGRRRARVFGWGSALAAAAVLSSAALGGIVVWHHGQRPAPISFRLEGASLAAGGYVEAGPSERPVLRFSDGSELGLAEGARVHVRSIDERGAHVTLDEGRAHAYVVHAPGTRWSFDAGPFVVGVTGTAFSVSWAEREHRLDVRLENGSVTVSGPFSDAAIALRAGQWLTVLGSEVLIRNLGQSEASSAEDATRAPSATADPAGTPDEDGQVDRVPKQEARAASADGSGRGRPGGATTPAMHHWAADLASGKVASIVDEALRLGLDAALTESTGSELAALADAARYTRREDIARDALFALRRRFPRSGHARDAAFLLGRLAEAQQDGRGALSWFVTYLSEAPSGTYASEALGRKMSVVQQLEGNDAARPVAEEYVRRFPGGTYAQAARAMSLAR